MTNVQRTVDAYASMGLPALEKMKRTNPKLLAAIAQENLEQTVAASGNNKAMAMGGAKPTVTDRKLGLAGLPGLGQREALGAAAPGIRQRGRQLQANQLARALQQNVRRPAGGITSMPLMRSGMRMAGAAGGAVGFREGGLPAIGKGQPIPMLMQKYGSEKVMEFLEKEKQLKDIEGNVAPERREEFEMMKANIESLFDPEMVRAIRRTRSGPDEVQLAGGGGIRKFQSGDLAAINPATGLPFTRDELEEMGIRPESNDTTVNDTTIDASRLPTREETLRDRFRRVDEFTQAIPFLIESYEDQKALFADPSLSRGDKVRQQLGTGLEQAGEFIVRGAGEVLGDLASVGAYGAGNVKDILGVATRTGALGEAREALEDVAEERKALTQQRNSILEDLNTINLAFERPGLEAADRERLQGLKSELERQLAGIDSRRNQLTDTSFIARGLDAIQSIPDALRGAQEFIADTEIGQRLLAENANRQDQREKTEIERRQAEELEKLEAGLTPGQKATRALQQGRPQDLFFPREEKEEKGAQPSSRSDLADSIFTFLQNLGYGSGASKGTVGSTYVRRRRDAEEAQAARQADADALDKRLAGALEVMREEQQIRGDQAAAIAVAGYRADLENNPSIVQSRAEYLKGKAEIEAELGDTFLASPFSDPNKEAREAALAALEARVRDKMVREYTATLQPTASGDTVDYTELLQETSN